MNPADQSFSADDSSIRNKLHRKRIGIQKIFHLFFQNRVKVESGRDKDIKSIPGYTGEQSIIGMFTVHCVLEQEFKLEIE